MKIRKKWFNGEFQRLLPLVGFSPTHVNIYFAYCFKYITNYSYWHGRHHHHHDVLLFLIRICRLEIMILGL